MSSERSTHTLSTAHRSRKSPLPWCDLREEENPTCDGPADVVLVGPDSREHRLCAGHAATLWLTNPTLVFSAKTRQAAIEAVMRQAFGPGGAR
jgi:hypothetical protein